MADRPWPETLETHLRAAVVTRSVECRGCGYDLQGLAGDRECPECGLPIAETIHALVDPEASRLPRLARPKVVGNALLQLGVLVTISALLRLGEAALQWSGRPVLPRLPALEPGASTILRSAACVAALAVVYPVVKLMPRGPGSAAVRRDVVLMGAGGIIWAVFMLPDRSPRLAVAIAEDVAAATGAIALLIGLGGVLSTVGRRSRAYRRSRAGRQGVLAMIAAIAGVTIALGVSRVAEDLRWPVEVHTLTAVAMGVCGLMIAIGFVYLVLNTWWIRTALHRPPPTLDELLLPRLPADSRVPMQEPEEEPGSA